MQHPREKGPPVPPARYPRYHLKEKLNILVNKINISAKDIHDEIQFIKQVPSHPRDRLKRKVKAIENNINIIKEIKTISPEVKKSAEALEDEVQFIKEVPGRPRNKSDRNLKRFNDDINFIKKMLDKPIMIKIEPIEINDEKTMTKMKVMMIMLNL